MRIFHFFQNWSFLSKGRTKRILLLVAYVQEISYCLLLREGNGGHKI
jgi:hypothetical protein